MSRIDPDVCAGHGKPCVKKAATQTMFGCKKATFTESPPAGPQGPPGPSSPNTMVVHWSRLDCVTFLRV
jgi:hypothetical protein